MTQGRNRVVEIFPESGGDKLGSGRDWRSAVIGQQTNQLQPAIRGEGRTIEQSLTDEGLVAADEASQAEIVRRGPAVDLGPNGEVPFLDPQHIERL